jgi:gamma-D-glutamyl-L-lysine dipeptidyl-peptidase
MHGYVKFGVVDLRKKPKFRSERISQLIYGEEVRVNERGSNTNSGYVPIEGPDNMEGYALRDLIETKSHRDSRRKKCYKLKFRVTCEELVLPFGSYLSEEEVDILKIQRRALAPIDENTEPVKLAQMFLGVPYLWEGTSDFGFDCSGFTQRLFRYCGKEIPRNSNWQRDASAKVESFDEARPNDLVFFKGHVGLYLGNYKMIHANLTHGGVSTSDLSDGSDYSKRLHSIFQRIGRFEL